MTKNSLNHFECIFSISTDWWMANAPPLVTERLNSSFSFLFLRLIKIEENHMCESVINKSIGNIKRNKNKKYKKIFVKNSWFLLVNFLCFGPHYYTLLFLSNTIFLRLILHIFFFSFFLFYFSVGHKSFFHTNL